MEENVIQSAPTGTPPETGESTTPVKVFTQGEVDQIVTQRIERERSTAQKRAEQDKLAASGHWEEIVKQKDAQIAELTVRLEQAEKLDAAASKLLKTQSEPLSESTRELLTKLSVVDQLEWLSKHAASTTSTKKLPTTPDPAPVRPAGLTDLIEKKKKDPTYSVGF